MTDLPETIICAHEHQEILMNYTYSDSNVSQVNQATVLIAEDHDVLRTTLRDWIRASFPNICVLEAQNGEEALSLTFDQHPDIILMDISMPQVNGIEATRRIKETMPQTEVVIVTIHENLEYQSDAAAAGASAYITKRKMRTELIPVLERLLPQHEKKDQRELSKE
jgi:two-component system nitrate/nitrite response regulator NarL